MQDTTKCREVFTEKEGIVSKDTYPVMFWNNFNQDYPNNQSGSIKSETGTGKAVKFSGRI